MCPDKQWHTYILPENAQPQFFETVYFVPNNSTYKSCDASDGKKILSCTDQKVKNFYRMAFAVTSSDSLPFNPGETLHFVATSFRTKANSNNLLGGSCNYTNNINEFKMKLKIYVCTDADVQNGNCELCKTDACYFSSCGNNCSDWKRSKDYIVEKNGTCNIQENRTCFNIFLNQQYTESRLLETQCTEPNCTAWIPKNAEIYKSRIDSCLVWQTRICSQDSSKYTEEKIVTVQCQNNICLPWNPEIKIIYFTNEDCAIQQTRACINPFTKIFTTEIQSMNISCHYVSNNRSVFTALKAEKFTSKENSQNLYTFGGVGGFLLILGFLIGTVSFRCYHKKKCLNHIKITSKGKKSFNNNAFVTDIQATFNNPHEVYTYNMFNSLQKDTEPILNFKKPNFYVKHVRSHSAVVVGSAKLNGVFPNVCFNSLSYTITSKDIEVSKKITSNQNLNRKASRLHNLEKEINISEKFETKKFTQDQSFSILI
ncbi:uncharacterized protein LOC136077083 [Hydra vulgaris]|uniref:Uncharacterized protein LOC136077083 n=1 Tax=Hydra vulgaris TaxID=6087 RepID=A0ABM4BFD7_HYDVU